VIAQRGILAVVAWSMTERHEFLSTLRRSRGEGAHVWDVEGRRYLDAFEAFAPVVAAQLAADRRRRRPRRPARRPARAAG
jgi:hypothetical protein